MRLSGATRSVNRDLEKRAWALAGWKGYVTSLPNPDPETVISAYHRLYNIEKSFAHVQVRPENTPPSTTSSRALQNRWPGWPGWLL